MAFKRRIGFRIVFLLVTKKALIEFHTHGSKKENTSNQDSIEEKHLKRQKNGQTEFIVTEE